MEMVNFTLDIIVEICQRYFLKKVMCRNSYMLPLLAILFYNRFCFSKSNLACCTQKANAMQLAPFYWNWVQRKSWTFNLFHCKLNNLSLRFFFFFTKYWQNKISFVYIYLFLILQNLLFPWFHWKWEGRWNL